MIETKRNTIATKAAILEFSGGNIIAKSPIILGANSKVILRKTAGSFHGQISRTAEGEVDLVAEMTKHPEALWIRVKAIEADVPNQNGDYFSLDEIRKAYRSFEGCPVFTNHENSKVENAKGKVVKAELDEKEGSVYCTMFIDREASPSLCRAIEEGYITDVSMGTQVDFSICSECEKKAFSADEYCTHIKTQKGRPGKSGKVHEKNFGLKFIEISVVTDGACESCTIREVLDPAEFLVKMSAAVNVFKKHVTSAGMVKDGGQAEIQKLNQAMDLLEDVSHSMLDQRQYIDLEFLSKLTDVLADLQHVNDELVDQGYGRVGQAAPEAGMPQPPPAAENIVPMQEPDGGALKPIVEQSPAGGVGKVTEPVAASSEAKILVGNRIKDLEHRVKKIYEEAKVSQGGNNIVDIKEKSKETVSKIAMIWENPSVRKYKMEVNDGDFKIVVGEREIIGLKGGTKVASLQISDLDEDVKADLLANQYKCAEQLLDSLKKTLTAGTIKVAEAAPSNTAEQQQQTEEAQLRTQKVPLHPRESEIRESITEDQLKGKRNNYEYHARTDEVRDSITEAQLRKEVKGYDYFKRQESDRRDITEKQLRDTGIKANTTPADSGPFPAGVTDQNQQITEAQLGEWKKPSEPKQDITEKQLNTQAEPWGRRIASKEDAKLALAAATKAIIATATATAATPEEIVSSIKDFTATPSNSMAAIAASNELGSGKETRTAMLRRAKFHGVSHVASKNEVNDYLLGAIRDNGLTGEVGLEVLASIAEKKNAVQDIGQAITAGGSEDFDPSAADAAFASSKDFLKEVLAETDSDSEPISIMLKETQIKADKGNQEAYAKAAFEAAKKYAEMNSITITENVHVAAKNNGMVEVVVKGTKKEEKVASVDSRKEARRKLVEAQMPPGGGMGGESTTPGAMPGAPGGAGGGTTMPPPPAGDPAAMGAPPVSSLGAPQEGEEGGEEGGDGEALPPGSICPVCGSDNVDLKGGEFDCNDCGAAGEFSVSIDIKSWPATIEETTPAKEEGGEGGIGEMEGGPGLEMPSVGMAAAFKITPEMVKFAGGKPIGSNCPHCGSKEVDLNASKGRAIGKCKKCAGNYRVDCYVDTKSNDLWARLEWQDKNIKKAAKSLAKAAAKKADPKKELLEKALKTAGVRAKFAKADMMGKAAIIADLHDKGLLV